MEGEKKNKNSPSLPSTWCGFSLVTILLWTCTNGSLVSSSSSKTSLVVMGHFRGEASSISITYKQKQGTTGMLHTWIIPSIWQTQALAKLEVITYLLNRNLKFFTMHHNVLWGSAFPMESKAAGNWNSFLKISVVLNK